MQVCPNDQVKLRAIPSTRPGQTYPLGTTVYPDGVNFCVFSQNAEKIELLFFDEPEDSYPSLTITLDPKINRTFNYWHIHVCDIKAGQLYAYRAYGPYDPDSGKRFDHKKILLDPYARSVMISQNYNRDGCAAPGDTCCQAPKGVIVDRRGYDWENDRPLCRPFSETVIYEMHVDSFTRHPNSGVSLEKRGTYAGLIEKIPYLKDLGVTAVELMPVQQFDVQDAPRGRVNYWGYSPIAFFAPHSGYSSRKDPLGPVDEFRQMVKELHKAGIEVILDVVFNHTAEGNEKGPTLSFRGLENEAYYILEKDRQYYSNYSGCGNTLNSNYSIVRRLILDCLRYWVTDMHIDGFRFDLASVMSRDEWGVPHKSPPILWDIETDPILAGTKIIAEAWDAAGLYQVGSFVGDRWAEWNGKYRDDIRSFVKSDTGMINSIMQRITGSRDLYPKKNRDPNRSINFITCHDGFTLNDLVSYNEKHNEANGEGNRDGDNTNHSWNCGVEGYTANMEVDYLRLRQIKNFLTILLISEGTPMLLMGDEIRRTKKGNNNTYCQNNELNWFDWAGIKRHAGLHRFVKKMIKFNLSHKIFQLDDFLDAESNGATPYITWHGVKLNQPDQAEYSHCVAFSLYHPLYKEHFHVMLNLYWQDVSFELPALKSKRNWKIIVDTSQPSPYDFNDYKEAPDTKVKNYLVKSRSVVIIQE